MGAWIGKNNRESLAAPLLDFREALQSIGLLRRYKGTLVAAAAAAGVRPRRSALTPATVGHESARPQNRPSWSMSPFAAVMIVSAFSTASLASASVASSPGRSGYSNSLRRRRSAPN